MSEYTHTLWECVGGNPLALKTALNRLIVGDLQDHFASLSGLFERQYTQLNPIEKEICILFSLLPQGRGHIHELISHWPFIQPHLLTLLQQHLLEGNAINSPVYALSRTFRHFLQHQYKHDRDTQQRFVSVLDEIDKYVGKRSVFILPIAENILTSDWLQIEETRFLNWVKILWELGLAEGNLAKWLSIFERYDGRFQIRASPSVYLGYGICLRSLSRWDEATDVFLDIVTRSGLSGQFELQTHALVELAVILRLRGEYTEAHSALERAVNTSRICRNSDLENRACVELAKIMLDRGNIQELGTAVENLPPSFITSILRCEYYLQTDEYAACHTLAASLLEGNLSNRQRAALHTILARCFDRQEKLHNALDHYDIALSIFEQEFDLFMLARSQSNLGAILIKLREISRALNLLKLAEKTQMAIGDKVGLTVTQHNLQLVTRRS